MPRLRERYSLAQFQQRFATEEACLDHLEQVRWPYGPVCPRCGVIGESTRLTARPRVRQCAACHKQFSVTAHTPLHKTHLPLSVWFTALYLLTQSSKGISALKLSVLLGLQYRTTWHLYHRIRLMMQEANPLLRDVIELDETYAGSPPRKVPAGAPPAPPGPTGRGTRRPLLLVPRSVADRSLLSALPATAGKPSMRRSPAVSTRPPHSSPMACQPMPTWALHTRT